MRSEHGNKPWITHSKPDTHGGMVMEQRLQESIAIISRDLEEIAFQLIAEVFDPLPCLHECRVLNV